MPISRVCPQGHRWETPADDAHPSATSVCCPVCGVTVELEAATLPPPLPAGPDSATLPPPNGIVPGETLSPPGAVAGSATLPAGDSRRPVSDDARAPAGYIIEKELGRGGMGVVYLARSVALEHPCALKMILAGVHSGDAEVERFRTEAQAIARMQHPGIVQVFEIGEHDGKPFMALEFCGGGSLDALLAKNPLAPKQAAKLVQTPAEAVHAAHQAKVIHRDLKPGNVLLTERGEAKVTDFGLAKKLDEQGATRTGSVMGTPSYMPPEQAEGKKDIGPAADVYALGAILYECLASRPPFRAATALDTILQVLTEEAVPVRQLNPQAPVDLETICGKCLQKDPGKRYDSALSLAEDLGRYQRGEPITARPVGRLERGWQWCRRNPAVASLLLLVAVLLLTGTGISTAFGVEASREAGRARDQEDRAKQEAQRG
jgi:serine/threonine protein kinase